MNEIGEKNGLGYKVNFPFPFGTCDEMYEKAFGQVITPIVEQYRPQFILVSAGFDGHFNDTVAELSLTVSGYVRTFLTIMGYASRLCEGRLVALLEGGYDLGVIGKIAVGVVAEMAGVPFSFPAESPKIDIRAVRRAEKVIEDVKRIHSAYWKLS
jgi:acetoin utilization deacetylase AcuC-like enzyme